MTPKGILEDDELPTDVDMMSRQEVWQAAVEKTKTDSGEEDTDAAKTAAPVIWIDDAFGALMGFVDEMGVKDNTLVVVMGDHGVQAKGVSVSTCSLFCQKPSCFGG